MSELTAILSADSSQLQKSLNDAKTILKRYKQEANSVSAVTNGQIAAFNKSVNSLNKLTNSAKTNSQQMSGLKRQLIELSTQYNALSDTAKKSDFGKALEQTIIQTEARYKELKRTVDDVNKSIGDTVQKVGGVKDVLNQMSKRTVGVDFASFTKVGAVVGTVAMIGNELKRSTEMAIQFEDALSNLSAITGMRGNDLQALKQQIIETGDATSKAYSAIADSYTKVGSKIPELLKQPKALDAVTRAVITLSKASRMTVDESTESLLGIMNQMGASANEAATYINVLAAGSKNGAGDIKYLSEAFNQCGTASSTAGLSIQEATALIEVLAQKIPNASTAGTNLRNILLKLATDSDNNLNPTIVGIQKALENLAKKADDTAYMTQKFGRENVSAAITLAQSAAKADELTKAVTGTNEAEDQAKTQTDNVAGAIKKLTQDWDNFITALNESQGVIKDTIKLVDGLINSWRWALSAKNAYNEAGDRGTSSAQETSDTYKQEVSKGNKTAKTAYEEYKRKMQFSIDDAERSYNQLLYKGVDEKDKAQQKILYNAAHQAKKRADELKKILAKVTEDDFSQTEIKTPKATTTTTTKQTSTKTQTETALEKYEREMSVATAKYTSGLNTQKEYFDDQIKAIQAYLSELTKDEKSMKANRSAIDSLTKKVKDLKAASSVLHITQSIYKEFAKTTEKYHDGVITQEEYLKEYRKSLEKVIDSMYEVDELNDEQKKAQKEYIKKLKDFDNKIDKISDDYQKKIDGIGFYKKIMTSKADIKDIQTGETPNELYQLLRQESIERKNLLKIYQVEKANAQKRAEAVGIEFDLDKFDTEFASKYHKILSSVGIKNNGNGTLLADIVLKTVAGEPDFDEWFKMQKWSQDWKGDKSNYSINATSNKKLTESTDYQPQIKGADKYRMQLDELLDRHKKIEQIQIELSKQQYDAGNVDFKIDTTELDNLETVINAIGEKLRKSLNVEMRVEGMEQALEGVSTIGHTVEMWRDMGDTIANAKDGFSAFMSVFDGLISTFETVNGLIQTYNSLQTLFAGVTTASAVATTTTAAAEGEKTIADGASTASATANAIAMKAEETAALDLAAALIFAAHASIPFAGVGIAAGQVSAMLGAMGGIQASTLALGSFADGGIIGGQTTIGDFNLARVNKGEMILNGTQQHKLFNLLNSGGAYSNKGGKMDEVIFKIKGDTLIGVQKNYIKKHSRL